MGQNAGTDEIAMKPIKALSAGPAEGNSVNAAWMLVAAALLAAFLLSGAAAHADTIPIESWFVGHTRAVGAFHNRIDGSRRQFTVETSGHWDGPVLTLAEDILYWDGEHALKVWRLTKTGTTTFVGTRSDVVGQAKGTIDAKGRLRLQY